VTDTSTQVDQPPDVEPADGLHHILCCEDDVGDVALCGTDVRAHPWADGDDAQLCVVCVALDEAEVCPRYGRCPDDE
jgi:hypothetical protein